jgi:hypothetical protein
MKQRKLQPHQIEIDSVKLYDKNLDLKKRWQIVFKVWNYEERQFKRKFDYDVNKYNTVSERQRFSRKRIKAIKKMLQEGFCISESVKISFTIESAFIETAWKN